MSRTPGDAHRRQEADGGRRGRAEDWSLGGDPRAGRGGAGRPLGGSCPVRGAFIVLGFSLTPEPSDSTSHLALSADTCTHLCEATGLCGGEGRLLKGRGRTSYHHCEHEDGSVTAGAAHCLPDTTRPKSGVCIQSCQGGTPAGDDETSLRTWTPSSPAPRRPPSLTVQPRCFFFPVTGQHRLHINMSCHWTAWGVTV